MILLKNIIFSFAIGTFIVSSYFSFQKNSAIDSATETIQATNAKLEKVDKEVSDLNEVTLDLENNPQFTSVVNELKEQDQELLRQIAAILAEQKRITNKFNDLTSTVINNQERIALLEETVATLKAKVENIEDDIEELQEDVENGLTRNELNQRLSGILTNISDFNSEIDNFVNEITGIDDRLQELESVQEEEETQDEDEDEDVDVINYKR